MPEKIILTKKDYSLAGFIGFCVFIFIVPIIKNIFGNKLSIASSVNLIIIALIFIGLSVLGLFIAGRIANRLPFILQLAKFILVGGFNTLLDWGVINLLIFSTGISSGYWFSVFKFSSFLIANVSSFFWNNYWTFQAKEKRAPVVFIQFFLVSLIGAVINVLIASLIVNLIGPKGNISPVAWAQLGIILATVFSMVWNFLGYKFFVFKK